MMLKANPGELPRQLLTFAGVGIVGFAVDATVLHIGAALGLGLYFGRIVSYLAAVTVTWALNRSLTFRRPRNGSPLKQWAAFATSQLGGASVNLGVYAALVATSDFVAGRPVIGVAVGSILGMLVNFTLARRYVFAANTATASERTTAMCRTAFSAFAISAAALSLCWTAILNGQPYFFADTTAYVRGADYAFQKVLHVSTIWSQQRPAPDGGEHIAAAPQKSGSLSSVSEGTVLSGRSIYYGALLYLGHIAGGFWLSIVVQAALIALAVFLTLRAMFGEGVTRTPIALAALAVLTPLSFFASYLMPDVLAGLAILASANLIALPHRLRFLDLALWFGVLTFAFAAHSSHLLIGAALAAAGVVMAIRANQKQTWRGLAVLCAAMAAAVVAEAAFQFAVTKMTGAPPIRPPFLMARVIDDGPGYRYLKDTCPGNGYAVCAFVDRLPLPSDSFLWDADSKTGVFAASTPAIRRSLSAEQTAFVTSAFAYDPLSQVAVSLRNWLRQASLFGLTEFNYGEGSRAYFAAKLPPKYYQEMGQTRAFHDAVPTDVLAWLVYVTTFASILYLLSGLVFQKNSWLGNREIRLLLLLIIGGVILNAAICGTMSTPHDRYQARVIWLLPFAALIYDFYRHSEWWMRVLPAKTIVPR